MTPKQIKLLSLTLCVALAATVAACYTKRIVKYLVAKKYEYLVTLPNERELVASFQYIDGLLADAHLSTQTDTADFVREFVYNNSIHLIDEEHGHYAENTNLMLNRMVAVSRHTRIEKPHMSCGPRAKVLEKILNHYGIRNRMVRIYSDVYDDVRSHTFTEVFHPTRCSWYIEDADFNIYYQRIGGDRVNLATMVLGASLDSIVPVSNKHVGWHNHQLDLLKEAYFKAMQVGNVVLINTNRFNLNKPFPLNDNRLGVEFFESFHLECVVVPTHE